MYPLDTVMGEVLLALELCEKRGDLTGVFSYNKDVFSGAFAQRTACHLGVRC